MIKTLFFLLTALSFFLIHNISQSQSKDFDDLKKNSIQVYVGGLYPFGSFNNHHNNSSNWGLKAEYKIARSTGISITYSSIKFEYEQENYVYDPNTYFIPSYRTYNSATQFTIGAKQYFPLSRSFLLYGNSEAGIYTTASGENDQKNLGLNIGGGALLRYNDSFGFFTETIAHHIFADENINFVSVQGGIKFNF